MSRISLGLLALVAAALLFALPVAAHSRPPAPTPSPTAHPSADPAITLIARQQFLAWQIGSIDKGLYDPRMRDSLTDAKVEDVSKHIAPLGALLSTDFIGGFSGEDFPPDARGYIYQMTCANGKMYEELVLTGGKIGYMFFRDRLTTEDVTQPPGAAQASPAPPPRLRRLAR